MIRSLISQLLRQFAFTSIQPDPRISLQDLTGDDISILCEIFALLVRQLPSNLLVFCLIDGIGLYETEQFLVGMDDVIMSLVDLAEQGGHMNQPTFKLLITSPHPTSEVRKVFDSEPDELLHMHNLPAPGGEIGIASVHEQLMLSTASRSQ